MDLDTLIIWLLLFAGSMFLASFAILIYACALLLQVREKVKEFGPPAAQRNGDWMERKRQERI